MNPEIRQELVAKYLREITVWAALVTQGNALICYDDLKMKIEDIAEKIDALYAQPIKGFGMVKKYGEGDKY